MTDQQASAAEALGPRIPIAEALPGVAIHPLETEADEVPTIESAFVLVKYTDSSGTGWAFRTSAPPNREELLGALMIQVRILEKELADEWDIDTSA